MMEIQQHDGVVAMELVVLRQSFAKLTQRRRGVGEGRGCALDVVLQPSPHPSIYREKGKGPAPLDGI